jgi:molecular chaperone DnaK (HSP70)
VNWFVTTNSSATSTSSASPPHPKASPRSRSLSTSTLVNTRHLAFPSIVHHFADGIVNVSAKDKATGKDQSMTIASSSGLSDKDIEKMVSDAEQYAETDKSRRALIEEANKADSVCADTEKGIDVR